MRNLGGGGGTGARATEDGSGLVIWARSKGVAIQAASQLPPAASRQLPAREQRRNERQCAVGEGANRLFRGQQLTAAILSWSKALSVGRSKCSKGRPLISKDGKESELGSWDDGMGIKRMNNGDKGDDEPRSEKV